MPRQRACFASAVCCTDEFADLPPTAQALYFQLGFNADNDGAVDGIQRTARAAGFGPEDVRTLYDARLLIDAGSVPFIAHWHVNNKTDNSNYRPGSHAHVLGTALELGEDRVYRASDNNQTDDSLASVANESKSDSKSKRTESKESELNEIREKGVMKTPAAPTASCPSCGAACAAYPDPLGNLVSFCPEHGDFTITAEGEVL